MCISPTILPDHGPVACRYCWQCLENRKNDFAGRCIAEQETSDGVLAVTLTYGGGDDNPNAAILVYKDFQDFLKRLRKAGYKVRYIVAGEYGEKKGRAHWHAVLFFKGKVPKVDINDPYYMWTEGKANFWPHGFSYFQHAEHDGFYYLLKYAVKEVGSDDVYHLAMSKKPPLGDAWVKDYAQFHVDQGLAPKSYKYQFNHVRRKDGTIREYMMQGKTRENFMDYYLAKYAFQKGVIHPITEALLAHMGVDPVLVLDNHKPTEKFTAKGYKPRLTHTIRERDKESWEETEAQYFSAKMEGIPMVGVLTSAGYLYLTYGEGETWLVSEPKQKEYLRKNMREFRMLSKHRYTALEKYYHEYKNRHTN